MANWFTLQKMSEKRGIPESALHEWKNLGYIGSSIVDNIVMLDEDSLIHFLDNYQTLALGQDSLSKIMKEKELEREVILSQLNNELFLLKTQALYQPLFHIVIQELGRLIINKQDREIFLTISSGQPITRVAAQYNMTYEATLETYRLILKELGKNPERIATYRNQTMKFLYGRFNAEDPTNVPLSKLLPERICRVLLREGEIQTIYQLLKFTSEHGWDKLRRFTGLGDMSYDEITKVLQHNNFIDLHKNGSITLTPEIAALVL